MNSITHPPYSWKECRKPGRSSKALVMQSHNYTKAKIAPYTPISNTHTMVGVLIKISVNHTGLLMDSKEGTRMSM